MALDKNCRRQKLSPTYPPTYPSVYTGPKAKPSWQLGDKSSIVPIPAFNLGGRGDKSLV